MGWCMAALPLLTPSVIGAPSPPLAPSRPLAPYRPLSPLLAPCRPLAPSRPSRPLAPSRPISPSLAPSRPLSPPADPLPLPSERPEHVEAVDGQQLCVVCRDVANGVHFGIVSCEGCKVRTHRLSSSDDKSIYINKLCILCIQRLEFMQ